MRQTLLFAISALVCFEVPVQADDPAPPKGFTALFNGKDLSGWRGHGRNEPNADPYELAKMKDDERKQLIDEWTAETKKHWKVVNGVLEQDRIGPNLATDQEFGDFELRMQIKGHGSLGLRYSSLGLIIPEKELEWYENRFVMVGERWSLYLDGKLVRDHDRAENTWKPKHPLLKKAPIQLLTTGFPYSVRNISIREIPSTEANEILRGKNNKGFENVFNGKDLTGWAGPIDQYEVKDGAIVCKPRKGGTIYTKAEYSDFIARLEFRLPPGGNNGLAIRYPGNGDTAYVGMCEIQVLDDNAKQYAKLDSRQYNGSAYGMVPAHRGYLRPVGEWNFEEVTIKGSTIKVELNGTMILDTDLSEVTKYMANSAHPGKTRTKGHFGFAGHSDPVAFRNVQIKVLEK